MAAAAFADAFAPNLTVRLSVPLAALAWRGRERRPLEDAEGLPQPVDEPNMREGLRSRSSIALRLRDLAGVGRR